MIQDIEPKIMHNEYMPKNPGAGDYIAVFSNHKILAKETGGCIGFPRIVELPFALKQPLLHADTFQYLFCIGQDSYFLYPDFGLTENSLSHCPESEEVKYTFVKMSDMRHQAGRECCYAAYTAYHLYQWYRGSQFCGCCGARVKPDTQERMLFCAKCGNKIYPKISPAVIAAVTNGEKLLLTKYAGREYKNYALIAGFTEIGETAEDTVRREVMEEAGLHVKNIRYYKTQPWGIDGNLLIGYFAELDGSDSICMDKNELSVAEWAGREMLKDMDDSFSLTREMIRVFYEGGF